ncbi:hypothetical protein PR048_010782 [Dryococelus australis]|uniref:Uncharacterized protein n=1 Tax=Dryococelus australis TaxID=614101 RepID=A0ABQ9I3P2_9NEOP|nr:hypothetical protein PR048_010782 [Dryococelus australis]
MIAIFVHVKCKGILYPNLRSAIRPPVLQWPGLPVPSPPNNLDDVCEELETHSEACGYSAEDDDFVCDALQLFTQSELNGLVRHLDLPKQAAELLGSRLKEKSS